MRKKELIVQAANLDIIGKMGDNDVPLVRHGYDVKIYQWYSL